MRTLVLGLALVASLLLIAPDALAGGWLLEDYLKEKAKSDWDGCGVGSMTHRRITQKVVMPGQPAPQEGVMETRKTVTEITETEYVIKVETLQMGQWTTEEEREKKKDNLVPKVEDQGKETLSILGTDYECAKKKITWMKGEEVDETVTVWAHAEKGILKMKIQGDNEVELVTKAFDGSWTVGDKTYEGRSFDMSMTAQRGMIMKGTSHMSLDVPEGNIRTEIKGAQGPVTVDVTVELVAFEKK